MIVVLRMPEEEINKVLCMTSGKSFSTTDSTYYEPQQFISIQQPELQLQQQQMQQQQQQQQLFTNLPFDSVDDILLHCFQNPTLSLWQKNNSKEIVYKCLNMNVFTSFGSWPKQTNIKCWWCRHKFETVPVPLVKDKNKENNIYNVYGCFCSFNCALGYLFDSKDSYLGNIWYQISLLQEICQKFGAVSPSCQNFASMKSKLTNEGIIQFVAPSWQILTSYGGEVPIEVFRSGFISLLNTSIQYPFHYVKSETIIQLPSSSSNSTSKRKHQEKK